MKYFEIATRWNQAEIMILIHLQALSIQSWFSKKIEPRFEVLEWLSLKHLIS